MKSQITAKPTEAQTIIVGALADNGVELDTIRLMGPVLRLYDLFNFPRLSSDVNVAHEALTAYRAKELHAVAQTAAGIAQTLWDDPDRWLQNKEDEVGFVNAVNERGEPVAVARPSADNGWNYVLPKPQNEPAQMTALGFIWVRAGEAAPDHRAFMLEFLAEWTLLRYELECDNAPETYAAASDKFPHNFDSIVADCEKPMRWRREWNQGDVPSTESAANNILHGGVLDLWNDEEWGDGVGRVVDDVIRLFADIRDEAEELSDRFARYSAGIQYRENSR